MGTPTVFSFDGPNGVAVSGPGITPFSGGGGVYDTTDYREGISSAAVAANTTAYTGFDLLFNAADTTYAFDMIFKTPQIKPPSGTWGFWVARGDNGGAGVQIGNGIAWSTSGKLYHIAGANTDFMSPNTTDIVPASAWVRVQMRYILSSGTIDFESYIWNGSGWTLLTDTSYTGRTLGSLPVYKCFFGILAVSANTAGAVLKIDRFRAEDGRTTAILDEPASVTDVVGIYDAVSVVMNRAVSINDNVGIGDFGIQSDFSDLSNPADVVGITDAVTLVVSRQVLIVDAVGIADAFTGYPVSRIIGIADAVGLTDAMAAPLSGPNESNASDFVAITDNVVAAMSRVISIADGVGIGDGLEPNVNRPTADAADMVGIHDSVVMAMTRFIEPGALDPTAAENRPVLNAIADWWRDYLSGDAEGEPDPSPGGAEVSSISPTTFSTGAGTFSLVVLGTNFVRNLHEITINGQVVPTNFVSSTQLTTQIVPSQWTPGAKTVRVAGAEAARTLTVT